MSPSRANFPIISPLITHSITPPFSSQLPFLPLCLLTPPLTTPIPVSTKNSPTPSNIFLYFSSTSDSHREGNGTPLQYSCLENPMDGGAWKAAVHGVAEGRTRLSDFTFTFHSHALEKEMATHSSVIAPRIPGTREPGGLLSMESQRVRHDWSDLAAAAVILKPDFTLKEVKRKNTWASFPAESDSRGLALAWACLFNLPRWLQDASNLENHSLN